MFIFILISSITSCLVHAKCVRCVISEHRRDVAPFKRRPRARINGRVRELTHRTVFAIHNIVCIRRDAYAACSLRARIATSFPSLSCFAFLFCAVIPCPGQFLFRVCRSRPRVNRRSFRSFRSFN